MRRLIAAVALLAGAAAVPTTLLAQGMAPHHEFGVDVGLGVLSPSGGSSHFVLATPVDVRLGFVSASPLSWEGRLTLIYDSRGYGSNAAYSLAPDIQALLKLGKGGGPRGLLGAYETAGMGLDFRDAPNGTGGTNSTALLRINGGIGDRLPYGSGAVRIEGFVAYDFKSTTLGVPATVEVGARVGLSLWH